MVLITVLNRTQFILIKKGDEDDVNILYARHYNPLLIRNHSLILTIHKVRFLRKKPLEKQFLDFKKWVKSIQTAGYNGARTVVKFIRSKNENFYATSHGRISL